MQPKETGLLLLRLEEEGKCLLPNKCERDGRCAGAVGRRETVVISMCEKETIAAPTIQKETGDQQGWIAGGVGCAEGAY